MIKAMHPELRNWLLLAAFSLVFMPLAVFFGGLLLAGPYEGNAGFLGMTGEIYRDALTGGLSAVALLLAPVILVAIWRVAAIVRRLIAQRLDAAAQGQ